MENSNQKEIPHLIFTDDKKNFKKFKLKGKEFSILKIPSKWKNIFGYKKHKIPNECIIDDGYDIKIHFIRKEN